MADLAEIAGVSKSTVSRALSNSPLISDEVKERIQALAKKHNYRLNTQARNFRTKETLTIAVVIPSADEARWQISESFFLELLGSISVSLIERGHQMLLSNLKVNASTDSNNILSSINCDGIIVIGQSKVHQQLNALAASYSPMVVWGAKLEDQTYCTVGGDNLRGGALATQHLIDNGCKNIAVIGDWSVPEDKLRFEGYQMTLKKAGLKMNDNLHIATGTKKGEGYDATLRLLSSGIDFDAIFALSDALAMAAINALDEHGFQVPKDIAVIGYDDTSLTRYYTPSLSSIHQDREIGGRLLVEKLMQIIDGEEPKSVILPTNLVARNSTRRNEALHYELSPNKNNAENH